MRARQAQEPLQGVRWGQHLCARQAEEPLQGVRGYQGWLGDAAALGTAVCNHDLGLLFGSHRGALRGLADLTSAAGSQLEAVKHTQHDGGRRDLRSY